MTDPSKNMTDGTTDKLSKEMAKELVDMIADVEREEAETVSSDHEANKLSEPSE